jgi:hypothetical protein
MARRSLKPQLNQIRAWVRQGRTDAWIAHQLEVSASELREFRNQHDLNADEEDTGSGEIDLRDEIEAEIEAAAAEEEEEAEEEDFDDEEESEDEDEEEAPRERPRRRPREGAGREPRARESAGRGGESGGDGRPRRRRRRGRRGGRGRRRPEYEATFDHGERDGYGLWLDPSVKDNPVYAQHWAGKSEVTVRIDPDQIVIRRPGAPAPESDQ